MADAEAAVKDKSIRLQVAAARLVAAARAGDRETLWRELLGLVPDFQGQTGDLAQLPPAAPAARPGGA